MPKFTVGARDKWSKLEPRKRIRIRAEVTNADDAFFDDAGFAEKSTASERLLAVLTVGTALDAPYPFLQFQNPKPAGCSASAKWPT
jgi:hypothetical protein